jgi:hypothetical protein
VEDVISYHGYLPLVKQYLQKLPPDHSPTLLEVGVDRGVSLIPLVAFLARTRKSFTALGIDVMVQEQVRIMLMNLDLTQFQLAHLVEDNSLKTMPKMIDQGMKFDVLLIDGDHNYYTVAEELKHLGALTHPHSLVIMDDYDGRWAERDLFYAERDDYKGNVHATPKVETEKHGVKAAVDEWLAAHSEWKKTQPIHGEPIMLQRQPI